MARKNVVCSFLLSYKFFLQFYLTFPDEAEQESTVGGARGTFSLTEDVSEPEVQTTHMKRKADKSERKVLYFYPNILSMNSPTWRSLVVVVVRCTISSAFFFSTGGRRRGRNKVSHLFLVNKADTFKQLFNRRVLRRRDVRRILHPSDAFTLADFTSALGICAPTGLVRAINMLIPGRSRSEIVRVGR